MQTKTEQLDEIHLSLMNGQREQMVDQINEYGLYDFFADYYHYLNDMYIDDESSYWYFGDCVISYHRITNR